MSESADSNSGSQNVLKFWPLGIIACLIVAALFFGKPLNSLLGRGGGLAVDRLGAISHDQQEEEEFLLFAHSQQPFQFSAEFRDPRSLEQASVPAKPKQVTTPSKKTATTRKKLESPKIEPKKYPGKTDAKELKNSKSGIQPNTKNLKPSDFSKPTKEKTLEGDFKK